MHIEHKVRTIVAAAAIVLSGTMGADAATVSFGNFFSNETVEPTPSVTVTDIAGGVTVSVSSSGVAGKLSGFAFEVGDIDVILGDLSNFDPVGVKFQPGGGPNSGPQFAADSNAIGNVNFNGGAFATFLGSETFDVIFELAQQTDVSASPFTFDVAGVTAADFEFVGLRFQSIGDNDEGRSSKIIGTPMDLPPVLNQIPLPAALAFLLTGVGALGVGAIGRRRA